MPLLSFERANQWVPLDFMLKTDKMKLPLHEFSFVKATAPFNEMIEEFGYIEGHPASKGDIIIGNDVWIASRCIILSGVHIGNGSVIAANTVVAKDVEPYTIFGGNPARVIRKRFDDQTIKKLEEIQWWNWEYEYIYDAVPILQSNRIDQLFRYYDCVVQKRRK